jgi:hypothetical protein
VSGNQWDKEQFLKVTRRVSEGIKSLRNDGIYARNSDYRWTRLKHDLQRFNFDLAAKRLGVRTHTRKETNPTELVSVVIGLLHYMLAKRRHGSAKARIHRGKLGGVWSFLRAVLISGKSKVNSL